MWRIFTLRGALGSGFRILDVTSAAWRVALLIHRAPELRHACPLRLVAATASVNAHRK